MDLLTGAIIGCLLGIIFMLIAIPIKRVLKGRKKKELEKDKSNSNSNFDLD